MKKKISSPAIGSIVRHSGWQPGKKLKGYPKDILIKDGAYQVNSRISNLWTWQEVDTEKIVTGYGDFYESRNKYKVKTIIEKEG